ncbi:hypothetical protein [Xanthomonas virus PB119]|nr:hypothetical protein [Xanthomonas virus PB119]
MAADLLAAILAGLCAVLVFFIITMLETMPWININKSAFAWKAIPLFLIISIITYIIL